MCGLVGVINKLKNGFLDRQIAAFENLLYVDAVRGEDSTGAFCVNNLGNVFIAKEAEDSNHFLKQQEWKDVRAKAYNNGWALIGHNRKATRGSITDDNAHPFWVQDKLVLVHNGSLIGDHKKLADVAVDSEAIAHTLANEPDVEKALQKINGAYALIWYDVQNKKMNVIRNKERPLFWIETDNAFYFASESAMLYFALWRNGAKITSKDFTATLFAEHELSSFGVDGSITHKQLDCAYKAPPNENVYDMSNWREDVRAAMACGYDACDVDPPFTPDTKKDPMKPSPEVRKTTYGRWFQIKDTRYNRGQRIKVVVDDYHWDIDRPKAPVYLTGYTADDQRAFVMFQVKPEEVRHLARNLKGQTEALFNVVVESCGFNTTEVAKQPYDTTEGYIRIVGGHYNNLINVEGGSHATH
jgi:hypothetical protein